MSSATRNADEMIEKLNAAYHRARQEAVTNEMLDRNIFNA
jgi:F0F1-type ATP synthase gamma subunit